jgi:hypothetical protein
VYREPLLVSEDWANAAGCSHGTTGTTLLIVAGMLVGYVESVAYVEPFHARRRGWSVEIQEGDRCVGVGRWTGRDIVDRPPLGTGDPALEEAIYGELAAQLAAEIDAAFAETPPLTNAEGIDLPLIDEMLRLTPRERLLALQENVRAVLELMAHAGHAAP